MTVKLCPSCPFEAKSAAGLASHRRAHHPVPEVPVSNLEALRSTLDVLRQMGRVNPIDAAQVQLLRSMAVQLDADASNAALWRQYREALDDMVRADDDVDSDLAEALASLRSATPMGH